MWPSFAHGLETGWRDPFPCWPETNLMLNFSQTQIVLRLLWGPPWEKERSWVGSLRVSLGGLKSVPVWGGALGKLHRVAHRWYEWPGEAEWGPFL